MGKVRGRSDDTSQVTKDGPMVAYLVTRAAEDEASIKDARQSTEGTTHDGRLIGRGAHDQELDGNRDTRFRQVRAVNMM